MSVPRKMRQTARGLATLLALLALALAAWCWAQRSVYDWTSDTASARAEALQLADRAAGRATDDPLILAVLGTVHTFARNYGVARVMLERAVAAGKKPKVALTACMRKLLTILNAMLRDQALWDAAKHVRGAQTA